MELLEKGFPSCWGSKKWGLDKCFPTELNISSAFGNFFFSFALSKYQTFFSCTLHSLLSLCNNELPCVFPSLKSDC